MKQIIIIITLIFGLQINAMQLDTPKDDCNTQIVKSSSDKNGIVKKTNGEIVTNNETMSVIIDPCKFTVLIELNKKLYDLVLYKTDDSGTLYAATLDGKQIIKINVNKISNEVETKIGDLIFTTYIYSNSINDGAIVAQD